MKQSIMFGDAEVSRETLDLGAARAITALEALGIASGDAVAVMLRNDRAYLELMIALGKMSAYLVAVNWHFKHEEAAYVIADSGAKVLIIHEDLIPQIDGHVPPGIDVIVVPTPSAIRDAYKLGAGDNAWRDKYRDYDGWLGAHAPSTKSASASASFGSIIYTSGSTGRPKGVRRLPGTPEQQEAGKRVRAMVGGMRPGMRTILAAPFYHAGPASVARASLAFAELILVEAKFNAERILQLIETHRVTHANLVPVMLVRLLKLPQDVKAKYDLSSLEQITHGGSPCAPTIKRQMIEWIGPILTETYGSTEVSLITMIKSDEWLNRPGSVGRPIPGTRIRILRDDDSQCDVGEPGEIYVDPGPNAMPFTYHNAPDKRGEVERDGFISNGDVGYLDSDGYLFVTDRKRDMIISGGVNIYPVEIEAELIGMAGVRDCAVFGVPDEEFGEAIAAAIEVEEGAEISVDDVKRYLDSRIASYKSPRAIDFHSSLPRDAMGKIFKTKLRDQYWAKAGRKI